MSHCTETKPSQLSSSIGFTTVRHFYNQNDQVGLLDLIEHPLIAHP